MDGLLGICYINEYLVAMPGKLDSKGKGFRPVYKHDHDSHSPPFLVSLWGFCD